MDNYLRVAYDLNVLMRHTNWSYKKLKEYQEKRIREIVKYAYEHVPFYHERFAEVGLKPDNVRTAEDLHKIPIVRKKELQENFSKLISDEFNINKLRPIATSGSTGRPLLTYVSKHEDEFRKAKLLRPHVVCGQRPRDKWVLLGPHQDTKKIGGLQRLLRIYSPILVSIFDSVPNQISAINNFNPDVLDGFSGSLFQIARHLKGQKTSLITPKFSIGGAEVLDAPSRKLIEEAFNAPYYDQYACEEFQMLAWQCPEKSGYHIDADTIIMQFVDKNFEEVNKGEEGEIVCTSLFNYAMPLIRYDIGDMGVLSDTDSCTCGRVFPLMKMIGGRKESFIVLPHGRSLSPLAVGISVCAFKYFSEIVQYRFVQKRIDFFSILVKKKAKGVDEALLRKELVTHLRNVLKLSEPEVQIEVKFVNEIPLDATGKYRKVFSELNNYT